MKSFWRQQVERARHVASRGGLIVVSIHLRHSANAKAWPLIAQALEEIASLADPVGEVIESRERPNGLNIKKRTFFSSELLSPFRIHAPHPLNGISAKLK